MVRPTKRTPDYRVRLLGALRDGASYADAARAADVSPSLFRAWRFCDASLAAEAVDAQRAGEAEVARRMDALLAELKRKAESRTVEEDMWWLAVHFPNEWGPPRTRRRHRPRRRT